MAYEVLAACYDTFMDDVDYEKWSEYILALLHKYGTELTEDSTLVDLACGTAQLTCMLNNKIAAKIIAIDYSEEMLSVAAKKAEECNADITLYCQDMTEFSLASKADAIICTCDGVNYVDPEDIQSFFKRVYDNLKDGCVFAFDISSSYKLINLLGDNVIAEDRGDIAFIWENTLYDDCVQIDLSIFRQEQGNRYIKEEEQQIQFIYEQDYIMNNLKSAGFSETHAFGFNTLKKAKAICERLQFVAIK